MNKPAQKNKGGYRPEYRDYSRKLIDILPEIIGTKAKTIPEIADEADRANQTVHDLLARIKAEGGGKFHIAKWKRGIFGGHITPCYLWGPGEDAEKPAPISRKQITKRYQRSEKGRQAQARYRAKHRGFDMVGAAISKNPLMSVLFGK